MIPILLSALLAQAVVTPAPAPAKPAAKAAAPALGPTTQVAQRIDIDANKLDIEAKQNRAVWTGNVKVKRGDTRIACDRLVAHYTGNQQISRIECVGSVDVVDGDRRAKGERADFDNIKGLLVVTGSPEACQGPNHMRGSKVTFHMEKDVIEVTDPKVTIQSGNLACEVKKVP